MFDSNLCGQRKPAEMPRVDCSALLALVGELAELIERRKIARRVERKKRPVLMSEYVFHRNGRRIHSIRPTWATA